MVTDADTVVDPRTMMIIPVNARMAYDAMARPQGLNSMTFGTERSAVEKLK